MRVRRATVDGSAVEVARLALARVLGERACDLIAAGALLARDLGVRGAIVHALGQPPAEAASHALTGSRLLVRFSERAPALEAPVAALAPHQPRQLPSDRQVAHPPARALLDAHIGAAPRAEDRTREQLDRRSNSPARCTPVTTNPLTREGSSVILHPLLLPAPRSQPPRCLQGGADVSLSPSTRPFSKTRIFDRRKEVHLQAALTIATRVTGMSGSKGGCRICICAHSRSTTHSPT